MRKGKTVEKIVEFIKNNHDYFEKFITRSTYHSNAIEGNTLSYGDTYAIIWNDNDFTIKAKPRELYEAINYKYALSYLFENLDKPLSQQMIKDIAVIINKNIDEISGYRTGAVMIRGAEHIPPAANEINQRMMYLLYNLEKTPYGSVFEKAADFHLQFERIHPFSDGNGRTGRILINYFLLNTGKAPIIIPKDDRSRYFGYLADQNQQGLAEYFCELSEVEYGHICQFGFNA